MNHDHNAVESLGALLDRTQALALAERLENGQSLGQALSRLADAQVRASVLSAMRAAGLSHGDPATACAVLHAIAGALRSTSTPEPVWSLPDYLLTDNQHTRDVVQIVDNAQHSVVCSTYNFENSSQLWHALQRAANRGVSVRLFIDGTVNGERSGERLDDIARKVSPGHLYVSKPAWEGKPLKNHAKFIVTDSQNALVTSANFSMSGEARNVELGVLISDTDFVARLQRQIDINAATLFDMHLPPHLREPETL